MSFWDHMFDNDYRQREDITALRYHSEAVVESIDDVRKELAQTQQKLAQVQLVLEAMWEIMRVRMKVDRKELSIAIQRVDLADGVEDGRIGPDRSRTAPTCHACGRPINPKRWACIYCGADVVAEEAAASAVGPAPEVECDGCGSAVPERDTYFTEDGLRCSGCYAASL